MHKEKKKCLIAIAFSAIFVGSIPFAVTHDYEPTEYVKAVEETMLETTVIETEESIVTNTTMATITISETEESTATESIETTESETTTEEIVFMEPETEVIFVEEAEESVTTETEPSVTSVSNEIIETETDETTETEIMETVETTYSYSATDDEIMLLARVAEAEAGYVEEGRRYVIDTILNRVDSDIFPNTIAGVVYQKNQFAVITTGAIWNVSITEDRLDLVKEELTSRTNYEVGFFRAGYYGPYGTPLFECGGNYFSTIK